MVGRRVVLLVAALLLFAACGQADPPAGTAVTTSVPSPTASTPAPETTTATAAADTAAQEEAVSGTASSTETAPTEAATTAATAVAVDAVGGGGDLLGLVDALVVASEQPDGYDRDLFRHWVDADGDGCDTRREVLIAEAVVAPSVAGDCALADGVWVSRYDAETETGTGRGFDVDHLVPLKEAWESGAHSWDAQTRERFANDLGYEHSLIAVSAGSNRQKGAQDPTTWLPAEADQRCWYVAAWVHVKTRWQLSADPAEVDTLRNIISGCPDNAEDTPLPARVVTVAPQPVSATDVSTTSSGEEGCHPDYSPCIPHLEGDALNCGDLTAAQKPVTVQVPGVDPYRLDRDGDGQGCTS